VRIIPVIDLKAGLVVRGIGGRRNEYRPVQSVLTDNPSPTAVADAFVERLGLREIYLADLDAIAGADPAWEIYQELLARPLDLWVDAGIINEQRAQQLAAFRIGNRGLARIICGLESLPRVSLLAQLLQIVGVERLVFSLDLFKRKPLTTIPQWREEVPEKIALEVHGHGVRSLIVLDLAYVGAVQGVAIAPLCKSIANLLPKLELTAGGGVRGPHDLVALREAGCAAALVASALHDGRLGVDDLRALEERGA
jgi:phosphoribosylformimino-5-aminoimidazole carboxamide ribotide isomerase